MSITTKIIHSLKPDPLTGSISTPIYQTATYVQESPGVNKGYDYARTGNPTRRVLEQLVADLEGGIDAYAFATGLAAIDAVVKLLSAGDEILAVDDLYGGAYRLFTRVYSKLGINVRFVDSTDLANIDREIGPATKILWIESPTNPTLKITDIAGASRIAHARGVRVVVDNTFASPVSQRPLELGADIVIHSATKYLAGHSDLVAGLVVVSDEETASEIKFIQNASGAILGPQDCWLTIRGIETLELRFRAQSLNGFEVAKALTEHPATRNVYYPGLEQHKNHDIAQRQQSGLYGGVLSFDLVHDCTETASAIARATRYFQLAESLGGVKSLICLPSEMTHKSIPRERRLVAGVTDSLIRLSCGIESTEDLVHDILGALDSVCGAGVENGQEGKEVSHDIR